VYDHNQTALHQAAYLGHRDVIKEMLDCKADVHVRDNSGKTPLHYAIELDHVDVVMCLEYGAAVNIVKITTNR